MPKVLINLILKIEQRTIHLIFPIDNIQRHIYKFILSISTKKETLTDYPPIRIMYQQNLK